MRYALSPLAEVTLLASSISLAADTAELKDGTIWSHAATKGTRTKNGYTFTIDDDTLDSFVRNFKHGYPAKVPVDYDHGTTNGIATGAQPVIKAGDVLELTAVKSDADITPAIQAQIDKMNAEQLAAGVQDKVDSIGLWMRWRPTSRALSYIKAREYTELSIAFDDDWPDQSDVGQGPTILAVALCNRPFLDNMVSVAASHGAARDGGSGAGSPEDEDMTDVKKPSRWALALSALTGKPVETDEEITAELTALGIKGKTQDTTIQQLTGFRDVIAAELGGETDAAKAAVKIREITKERDDAKTQLTTLGATAVKATVDSTIKQYEAKLTVPLKASLEKQLTEELTAGKKLEDTNAYGILKSLAPNLRLEQTTPGDNGTVDLTSDNRVQTRADELLANDPKIKQLAATDPNAATLAAYTQAEREAKTGKK